MKKTLLITSLVIFAQLAYTQTKRTDIVQLSTGGGIHTLLYNPIDGARSIRLGYLIEAQYQKAITNNFSLGIGLNFMNIKGKATYNYSILQPDIMLPGANYPATVNTIFNNFTETQNFFQISTPLEAYYKLTIKNINFKFGAGLLVAIPFSNSFKTTEGTFSRTAYMDTTGVTFFNLPNHGLGDFDSIYNGKLKGKLNTALVFDIGADIYNSNKYSIYIGLYSSIALSPLFKSEHNYMFDENLAYHGSLTSNKVDKVKYTTLGIKIGIAIGVDKIHSQKTVPIKTKNIDPVLQEAVTNTKEKAIIRAQNANTKEDGNIDFNDIRTKNTLDDMKDKAKARAIEEKNNNQQ